MIKQTKAQALGSKGEQWFPAQLPEYWYFQKPTHDLGIDGVVVIAEQNHFNGLEFRVQIKSSREWKQQDNAIVLRGIKRTTARYWVAGSSPTLLVFYDESTGQGYCAWALDALPPVPDLLFGDSDTITIRAEKPALINAECWNGVRRALAAGIELFREAVKTGRVANIVFPRIRDIARCLQLIHLAEFTVEPKEMERQMLLSLGQAVAHRDIVRAATKILSELDSECLFARQLRSTIESYKSRVSAFYIGFDELVAEPDKSMAVRENRDLSRQLRPEMIQRATELILALATLGATDTDDAQQGAPADVPASRERG